MKFLMFDFDGVIVDTFRLSYETNNSVRDTPLSESEYRELFLGNFYKSSGVDPNEKLTEMTPFFQAYTPRLLEQLPIEGIPELIRGLQEMGYRMVIISSTMDAPIEEFLKKYQLRDAFQGVYGASVSKSKVYKIALALQDAGVEAADAVFITDTLGDIREAGSVGVSAIAVTWGFHPRETLMQGNPAGIAVNTEELQKLLLD